MDNPVVTDERTPAEALEEDAKVEGGGSMIETVGGAGVAVLAILGLIHVAPVLLASIATIVVGAAFLVAGGTIAARFSRVLVRSGAQPVASEAIGGGIAMESLCGATGIVLGILALVGAGPATLLPVAVIVYGGGLLVANSATARLNAVVANGHHGHETSHQAVAVNEIFDIAAAPGLLIALAGIVLGIIGLAHAAAITLSLVALLSYGFALVLRGVSLTSMMLAVFAA